MGYATTNPPHAMTPMIGTGPTLWIYSDTDAHTDVDAAGYFTDGADRGMKAGDVMIVVDTDTNTCTIHHVLNTTTISAATLS